MSEFFQIEAEGAMSWGEIIRKVLPFRRRPDALSDDEKRELLIVALMARELSTRADLPDDLRRGLTEQATAWDNLRRK